MSKKSKQVVLNPYSNIKWPVDENKKALEDLTKVPKETLVMGINSVTKSLEKSNTIKFIILSNQVPEIMTEHLKLICIMRDIPFLNFDSSPGELGSYIKQKSIVIGIKGNENTENFIKKYTVKRNLTLPWMEYKPLLIKK